jgi:predicted CopG family antitoxin
MVRKETREQLKKLRIAKRESYDEIINRLIDKCKQQSS